MILLSWSQNISTAAYEFSYVLAKSNKKSKNHIFTDFVNIPY